MTVEPQRTALERAVKQQGTLPDVRFAGVLLNNVGQFEDTLTLLDEACGTTEGTTSQCGGIGDDIAFGRLGRRAGCLLRTGALHPCGCIDSQYVG